MKIIPEETYLGIIANKAQPCEARIGHIGEPVIDRILRDIIQ